MYDRQPNGSRTPTTVDGLPARPSRSFRPSRLQFLHEKSEDSLVEFRVDLHARARATAMVFFFYRIATDSFIDKGTNVFRADNRDTLITGYYDSR